MGNADSTHVTEFHRPNKRHNHHTDDPQEHLSINISNKMVERLVEDVATKPKPKVKPRAPPSWFKEKYYNEKLAQYDEEHSRQWGLTLTDLKIVANRIERTPSPHLNPNPICEGCLDNIIECYDSPTGMENPMTCNGSIESFNDCVRKAMLNRVQEQTKQRARENAERSRTIARAKQNVLRELVHSDNREEVSAS